MKTKIGYCIFLFIGFVLLLWNGQAFGDQKILEVTQSDLAIAGSDTLMLTFNIGVAKVTISPTQEAGVAIRATVDFSNPVLAPSLYKSTSGTISFAVFDSGVILGPIPEGTVHEWQINIGNYDTDTKIEINFGGVKGDMDFGFAPLTKMVLNLGGDSVNLDFSNPTSRTVEEIILNGGGASVNMMNIGNTNFQNFLLNGGGLHGILAFHGALQAGKHNILVHLGGVSLQCYVPTNAGESVKALTSVATVNVAGDGWFTSKKRPFIKEYITTDYDTQTVQLDMSITAAASSVNIDRQ